MSTDNIDPAIELDRLGDLGRGSANWLPWSRPTLGVLFATIAMSQTPLTVAEIISQWRFPAEMAYQPALAGILCAGYYLSTARKRPDLTPIGNLLALSAKFSATALAGISLSAVFVAGIFGLVAAIPTLMAAIIAALGTALLNHGQLLGALATIVAFASLGLICVRWHFQSIYDDSVIHTTGMLALAVAAWMAALAIAGTTFGARKTCQ